MSEIVDELRATRPRASEALRLQVLSAAARPPVAAPSLSERLRIRRRVALAVPAAAGLAVAAAVAIGVSRPVPAVREAGADASSTLRSSLPPTASVEAGPPAASDAQAGRARTAPPGTLAGRAQRYVASLTLAVEDTDALSDATKQALAIARDLGGFVGSVQYATGEGGAASVTLRVPSARAGDAVTRLSALGTIVAQNVQLDDLQETLDGLATGIGQLRTRIARLSARLATESLDPPTRARLQEERAQAQAQLRELRATRAATSAEARLATIQVELRTDEAGSGGTASSRLERALDKALAVLAWEGIVLLAAAIALAPLALVAAAVWATRRTRRRREEDRLLAAS